MDGTCHTYCHRLRAAFRDTVVQSAIILLLLFNLLSPTPSFASSFSGSAALDWTSLSMSGIGFTLSNLSQFTFARLGTTGGVSSDVSALSNDWGNSTSSLSVPSVGSATASATSNEISASLSVVSDFSGVSLARRDAIITALNTGVLTISIPYRLTDQGSSLSGDWFAETSAGIQVCAPVLGVFAECVSNGQSLSHSFNDTSVRTFSATTTGIASLSIPFIQGENRSVDFDTRSFQTRPTSSIPGPETFWPFAVGWVFIALLSSKRIMAMVVARPFRTIRHLRTLTHPLAASGESLSAK